MTPRHRLLARQLKKLGIAADGRPPTPEQWAALLERVNHAYEESDQERYLHERTMEISSRELQAALASRLAAVDELRDALRGMLPEENLGSLEVSDTDLGAVARLVANLAREREAGRRALDNQKFALDQHASVSIADADGTITYVNQRFVDGSGFAAEELLGRNHRITSSGLHPPSFYREMWETISAGRVWHGEIVNRRKDGSLYWVATTIVPWLDEQGRPYQHIAIRTDITRQKDVEAEYRKLALIAARTDNAVVLTDAAGVMVWVNEGFTRLTGYTAPEAIGRKPGALLQGAGTDARTVRRMRERLQSGEGFAEEILNYRKDGRPYWLSIEAQPIRDDSGRVVNYMAIESDITERRASRQRLGIQFSVSSVLARPGDAPATIAGVLQVICDYLGWEVGQAWVVSGTRLQWLGAWHPDGFPAGDFVAASRGGTPAAGEDLPGRVWTQQEPVWVPDLARDAGFPRAAAATAAGLRSAIAFPVLVRGETQAVLEFFSRRIESPDLSLLNTFEAVGGQIGQFLVRREAEDALRQSEERFRSAFEDAHAGIAIGAPDTTFKSVNPALCDMLGYSEEELVGRTSLEITHPDDLAITRAAGARFLSGKTDRIELEKRFLRKDGSAVWVIVRGRRHLGRDGSPDLLISHFLDITERKRAERALHLAEERFRLALEAADLGTYDTDLRSGTASINDRYLEMLGYAPGEIEPRLDTWQSHLHPDDAARVNESLGAHLRGETEVYEAEYRVRHKAGGWIWVLDRGRVVERDAAGAPLRLCGTHLDITFRKLAEQRLREEKHLLELARRRELETGHEIQRSLLIGDVATGLRGVEIASYAEPSQVIDGDFFAFTTFNPDCFELLVGDVMGKGVPAALVGAGVRMAYNQAVTELAAASLGSGELPRPAQIIEALHARITPRLVELDTFVTLALYRFDLAAASVTFVNAGHTKGLLKRVGGVMELLGDNVPLGVSPEERYRETTLPLAEGDVLLVYSDGVTEAHGPSGPLFGEARLQAFVEEMYGAAVPPAVCLQALRKRVRDFVGGSPMVDDQTAVLVSLRSLGGTTAAAAREETLTLPWRADGLGPLRGRLAQLAVPAVGADAASRLVLAAFEVATNVVRHVQPPFADATLTCRIRPADGEVAVEFWHIGLPFEPGPVRLPEPDSGREGGYGLYIIEQAVSEVVRDQPALDVCRTRLVLRAGED